MGRGLDLWVAAREQSGRWCRWCFSCAGGGSQPLRHADTSSRYVDRRRSRRDRLKVARQFTGGIASHCRRSPVGTTKKELSAVLTGLEAIPTGSPPLKWRATLISSRWDEVLGWLRAGYESFRKTS